MLPALVLALAAVSASPAAAQTADRVWDVGQRCFRPADDPSARCGVVFDVGTGRYVTLSAAPVDAAASAEAAGSEDGGLDPIVADDLAAATRRADPSAPDGLAALRDSQRLLEESLGILGGGG